MNSPPLILSSHSHPTSPPHLCLHIPSSLSCVQAFASLVLPFHQPDRHFHLPLLPASSLCYLSDRMGCLRVKCLDLVSAPNSRTSSLETRATRKRVLEEASGPNPSLRLRCTLLSPRMTTMETEVSESLHRHALKTALI
jgi:hypothetical protein